MYIDIAPLWLCCRVAQWLARQSTELTFKQKAGLSKSGHAI